jgi:hypothetical protein
MPTGTDGTRRHRDDTAADDRRREAPAAGKPDNPLLFV